MSGVACQIEDFKLKEPLTTIVSDNIQESLKRVKRILFEDAQVVIELITRDVSVKGTIMILDIIVEGTNFGLPYVSDRLVLTAEYKDKFVDYDHQRNAILIPISGVEKITFRNDRGEFRTFSKQKSDS